VADGLGCGELSGLAVQDQSLVWDGEEMDKQGPLFGHPRIVSEQLASLLEHCLFMSSLSLELHTLLVSVRHTGMASGHSQVSQQ
jgi:hypothetical protein